MMFLLLASTLGLVPSVLGLPANHDENSSLQSRQTSSFPYGSSKIRGVNLGGWLVLEPWITPSLFDATGNGEIIDEYTFCQKQDKGKVAQVLEQHWNTWIVENDFQQIAAAGLNHVRIPIGFWAFDVRGDEPYYKGNQVAFLDKAIGWARNHNLKVLIDLHGAPGSQNGYDNSGKRGDANFANDPSNVERVKAILHYIAQKYAGNQDTVTSIEVLNEPAGYLDDHLLQTTKQMYTDTYDLIRKPNGQDNSNYLMVIADAFQDVSTWNGFMAPPSHANVALDTHHNQVFSPGQVAQTPSQHLKQTCDLAKSYSGSSLWLLVGEWSLATTDCAKYLNGFGRGSRYEGQYDGGWYVGSCDTKTGDGKNFAQEYKDFMRQFFDIQVQTYERYGEGWFHWTWKNENAADWSYQAGLAGGWIPRDPGNHIHDWDAVCGNL